MEGFLPVRAIFQSERKGEDLKHFIVYSSPSGSTRHIAELIYERLTQKGCNAGLWDLGKGVERQNIARSLREVDEPLCLWIGSPVYVDHAVPPVEAFLEGLPSLKEAAGVPFVTWGAVSSGVALLEMGRKMREKGLALLGGAKIVALHSFMWKCQKPLGAGHPAPEDEEAVEALVDKVLAKLLAGDMASLSLSVLDYLPPERKKAAEGKSISKLKKLHPEFAIDAGRCTQCGVCREACPADAVSLDPYPRISDSCFLCGTCARLCPEDAVVLDLSSLEEYLPGMARKNDEKPLTEIFF